MLLLLLLPLLLVVVAVLGVVVVVVVVAAVVVGVFDPCCLAFCLCTLSWQYIELYICILYQLVYCVEAVGPTMIRALLLPKIVVETKESTVIVASIIRSLIPTAVRDHHQK